MLVHKCCVRNVFEVISPYTVSFALLDIITGLPLLKNRPMYRDKIVLLRFLQESTEQKVKWLEATSPDRVKFVWSLPG